MRPAFAQIARKPTQQEQQQRHRLSETHPCPSCPRPMRFVGREGIDGSNGELLTFQCDCGQVIALKTH